MGLFYVVEKQNILLLREVPGLYVESEQPSVWAIGSFAMDTWEDLERGSSDRTLNPGRK
ncbi:MAG: hypothetical protein BTN85_1617 [Candidatus Methanohalarchaeum thermophilum]|uniref:Uncharacterized protein n=1 Tax=Methanohalarchaeum thermophilum TaxID=1903181 RepID=A0A1Q6DXP3_METT1|nr:MAG: hypothetical protein BTN85_1617 [Candidatus Methanohalarchaeum thermophilum]